MSVERLRSPYHEPPPTGFYPLSLHDALPISLTSAGVGDGKTTTAMNLAGSLAQSTHARVLLARSEEHTSELQSPYDLVCRLLLEKKKPDRKFARPEMTAPALEFAGLTPYDAP